MVLVMFAVLVCWCLLYVCVLFLNSVVATVSLFTFTGVCLQLMVLLGVVCLSFACGLVLVVWVVGLVSAIVWFIWLRGWVCMLWLCWVCCCLGDVAACWLFWYCLFV